MKATIGAMRFDDLPTTYAELVALLVPRPIRDDVDFRNVTAMIDLMAGHGLTPDQDDYLDILSDLVEKYEDEHHPINDDLTPLEALQLLMDQHGLSASDLGNLLGDRSLGTRILSGERQLSKAHIRTLAGYFKVSPAIFI